LGDARKIIMPRLPARLELTTEQDLRDKNKPAEGEEHDD
jgi:hypothetical protein